MISAGAHSCETTPRRSSPGTSSTVTATFQLLYVFVLVHHGFRRLVHFNVTAQPTAAWTLQQLSFGMYFITVRGETRMPSLRRSSLAMP